MNKFFPVAAATVGFLVGSKFTDRLETQIWRDKFKEKQAKIAIYKKEKNDAIEEANVVRDEMKLLQQKYTSYCPAWDSNWDGREENKPPKGVNRTLILVRHGLYHDQEKDKEKKVLTELGKKQMNMCAQRLQQMGFNYDKIHISSVVRATESGNIVRSYFPDVPYEYYDILAEGNPGPRIPSSKVHDYEKYKEPNERIKKAFYQFFHRADSECTKPQIEVIVCHQNVIRSFLCRSLQIPIECWLRFGGWNAGITILTISPSGTVSCKCFADIGYQPPEEVTFSTSGKSDLKSLEKNRYTDYE